MNGNLYIDFYESIFKLWLIYCLLVRTTMSAVLFVAINFSSSVSAERTENGKVAAQQILARVAVRVCMYVPIGKNNVRVARCCACARPRSTE